MATQRKTKLYRRRISILLSAMGLGILTGVIGVLLNYKPTTMELTVGDSIVLPVSTFFCDGMEVRGEGSGVRVYALPFVPELSKKRWSYTASHEFGIAKNNFGSWSAYLLKHSILTVTVCSDDSLAIFVFRGRGNYNQWKKDHTYSEYMYESETYGYRDCSLQRNHFIFRLQVKDDDNYFVVYWHTAGVLSTAHVKTHVTFNRTVYDMSRANLVCDSNSNPSNLCQTKLKFASYDVTMVQVTKENPMANYFRNVKVVAHPHPRGWFYAALFGGIFGFFAVAYLTLSLLSKLLRQKHEQLPDEQVGLIDDKLLTTSQSRIQGALSMSEISSEEFSVSLDHQQVEVMSYRLQYEPVVGPPAIERTCITAGISAV